MAVGTTHYSGNKQYTMDMFHVKRYERYQDGSLRGPHRTEERA